MEEPYIVAIISGTPPTYLRSNVENPPPEQRLTAMRGGQVVGHATLRAFIGRGGRRVTGLKPGEIPANTELSES